MDEEQIKQQAKQDAYEFEQFQKELEALAKSAEERGYAMLCGVHWRGGDLVHLKLTEGTNVQDMFVIFSNLARHAAPLVLSTMAAVQREFDVHMMMAMTGAGGVGPGGGRIAPVRIAPPHGMKIVDPRGRM